MAMKTLLTREQAGSVQRFVFPGVTINKCVFPAVQFPT